MARRGGIHALLTGRTVVAVGASIGWMVVSSGLILLNKQLLSHGFSYPMALSSLGMLFSSVASYLACKVRKLGGHAEL